jgi:hypothetical protein
MALWGNRDSKTASGTVAIANTGVVTGTGTSFTTQAKIGNTIRAGGVDYEIVTITSNTVCKVESGVQGGAIAIVNAGASYTLSEKPAFVAASESATTSGVAGDSNKVFGVDTGDNNGENYASAGKVVEVGVATGGTQYAEVPTVTFSGGGGSSAAATATISGGVVTSIAVTNNGSSYEDAPTVTLNAPTISFNGFTNPNTTTNIISYTGHRFVTGDAVTYNPNGGGRIRGEVVTVNGTSTGVVDTVGNMITSTGHPFLTGDEVYYEKSGSNPIAGLTTATSYYIERIDANRFALYNTYANSLVHDGTGLMDLTAVGNGTTDTFKYIFNTNQTYYVIKITNDTLQLARTAALAIAETEIDLSATFAPNNAPGTQLTRTSGAATAVAALGGGTEGGESESNITHAGWIRRTVGTGGRAGRVQYETLVAMGSMTGDQADDRQFPDD